MASSDLPLPERLQIPVPCDSCDTGYPGKHYCTVCRKTMCNSCHTIHAKLLQNHKVVPRAKMTSFENSVPEDHSENENVKTELDKIKTDIQNFRTDIMKKLTVLEKRDLERLNDIRKDFKEIERELKKLMYLIMILSPLVLCTGFLQFQSSFTIEKIAQQVDTLNIDFLEIRKALNICSPLKISTPEIVASYQAEVKGLPCFCTTHDGRAWIGGSESRELILVDINGKIYNRRKLQHRTFNLAKMTSGDIIMKPRFQDSNSVIKLERDSGETGIYDSSPNGCYGVSVTSDERILICCGNGSLMACNSDGANVQEIYKNDKTGALVHAIELPNKTICIDDWSNKRLVVIDKDGQQITAIVQPLGRTNFLPRGLACDRMGNILSVDKANDCVYIIDQNRQVKELVGSSHGIKRPAWIDIDKDDNLWIAQGNGTVTVVKYLACI